MIWGYVAVFFAGAAFGFLVFAALCANGRDD